MNDDTNINDLYTKLLALSDAGDEAAAKKLVQEALSKMSEEEQGAVLTRMYVNAAEREIADADAIAEVQEESLGALELLETEKQRLEQGGATT